MIVGNGLVATAFEKYQERSDVVLFASGVSNSLETNIGAFSREENLLKKYLREHSDKRLIYFGTCSIYDPSVVTSAYVQHKLKMERIVVNSGSSYAIFRLPQIVGKSSNNMTLLNYLYKSVVSGHVLEIWRDAIRYIVDIEDVVRFVTYILDGAKRSNVMVNLVTSPSKVLDILICLENIIGKKAIFRLIAKGTAYSIPLLDPELTLVKAGIVIDKYYLERVLRKYYAS